MTQNSKNKVAILVADGFEQVEMTKPQQALEEAALKLSSSHTWAIAFRELEPF